MESLGCLWAPSRCSIKDGNSWWVLAMSPLVFPAGPVAPLNPPSSPNGMRLLPTLLGPVPCLWPPPPLRLLSWPGRRRTRHLLHLSRGPSPTEAPSLRAPSSASHRGLRLRKPRPSPPGLSRDSGIPDSSNYRTPPWPAHSSRAGASWASPLRSRGGSSSPCTHSLERVGWGLEAWQPPLPALVKR